MSDETMMRAAIAEAAAGMRGNEGGPFGCVVVRRGAIVARGRNGVTSTNDPTAHAEVTAIRAACRALGTFVLDDCELYTSCEPCPMCLAAIYWARIPRVFYGNSRADAAAIGFDDDLIYREIARPPAERTIAMKQVLPEEARKTFQGWQAKPDRTP
ncbi:MAG TPA: nucleoside deaminase [Opitutaceae bacterium]|nr:nucleoside deaminase [Opitutaceae bacterium]